MSAGAQAAASPNPDSAGVVSAQDIGDGDGLDVSVAVAFRVVVCPIVVPVAWNGRAFVRAAQLASWAMSAVVSNS